ncbi:MAG: hypothetical protein K0B15_07365 [Lentimicrobium sp.]|nr:hypothetical protein [Lentimicrobium sp.]
MKEEDFLQAIKLIALYHSTEIEINHVPENGKVKIDNRITIKRCCAGLFSELVIKGYSLYVSNEGLIVNKF